MKLTKEEALKKIEELKAYVNEQYKTETKTVGVAINHCMLGSARIVYQSSKSTQREAVLEAIESGANLRGADLRGADLSDADLSDADLSDADLRGANLRGADLSDADLSDADLRGANLSGADLSDADLRGANLSGANLRGAELDSAKFYGRGGTRPLKRSQLPAFLAALGFVIED